MRTLNALSAIYLAGASVFGVAIAVQRNPDWSAAANRTGQVVWPMMRSASTAANEQMIKPAVAWVVEQDKAFFDSFDPPKRFARRPERPHARVARSMPAPVIARSAPPPARLEKAAPIVAPPETAATPDLRPAINEPQQVAKNVPVPAKPALTLAPQTPPNASAIPPDLHAPPPAELARVMLRLKDNLTREMLSNFELFLYVSKADSGPWAQRMYVFRKQAGGDLDLMYDWPVSTGRELVELAPNGQVAPSFTPQGYYELDPDRMYKHHVSGQWRTPMPYAMFFNWEKDGLQTGLAIHSATGDDIAALGTRASAGCIRLAPENAAALFNLIRADYRGLAPRFAYDRRTATMSNDGLLMHDAQGRVQLADGYRVLVFIENYGGDNVVAAVF